MHPGTDAGMLSTLQTPNPLISETGGRVFPRFSWQSPAAAPRSPDGCGGTGSGSSHLLAAISNQETSHIICLLTINKAFGVGCQELLRNHNAV